MPSQLPWAAGFVQEEFAATTIPLTVPMCPQVTTLL
jgi:hypothetical protein